VSEPKQRSAPVVVVLVAALLLGAFLFFKTRNHARITTNPTPSAQAIPPLTNPSSARVRGTDAKALVSRIVDQVRAERSGPPPKQSNDYEVLRADLENILSSRGTFAEWTPDELNLVKQTFSEFLEVKTALESGLARPIASTGRVLEVEIPPYPEIGAELRRAFYEAMAAGLPSGKMDTVDNLLGQFLDHHFAYYGNTRQKITVAETSDPTRGRLFAITHAMFADNASHPANPWRHGEFVSSTSSSTLSLHQIETGAYESIAPLVAGKFGPRTPGD
jgi:hypothetical protein